jgi:hypothetical protein
MMNALLHVKFLLLLSGFYGKGSKSLGDFSLSPQIEICGDGPGNHRGLGKEQ